MRKSFKLEDLDCANCAAKMQDAISKMPGVEKCTVNFMMQKLTIVCAEEKLDEIMKKAAAACRKIEPDCRILV